MARVVRTSKFRHVFGQAAKKSECYDNIRITANAGESTFCSVNPKFVAIITASAGGGAFLVLPLDRVGRAERDVPLVSGHKGPVLDIAWCPHNDNLIASGSEDCTIKIWEIPDGGITETLTQPSANLVGHQRRVGLVLWHPSAQNVLLSASGDTNIFIWNVETSTVLSTINCHPDSILSVSWNYDGSRIVTSCKDKMLRIINPRTGEIIQSGAGHQGAKPTRVVYLRDGRIFSTGFSKMAERQYAVWDENLGDALTMVELDSSNGILFPFYDVDNGLIFLCGKGDSTIRYFEYTPEAPYIHYLSTYTSNDSQRGIGAMPKRGLHVSSCEIARFYKLLNSGLCEVITFIVPRKFDFFQDDLYPDTAAEEYAITADQWIEGQDADPKLMSLRDLFSVSKTSETTESNGATQIPTKTTFEKSPTSPTHVKKPKENKNNDVKEKAQHVPVARPPPVQTTKKVTDEQHDDLVAQVKALTSRVDELERRLKHAESSSKKDHHEAPAVDENDSNDDLKF